MGQSQKEKKKRKSNQKKQKTAADESGFERVVFLMEFKSWFGYSSTYINPEV